MVKDRYPKHNFNIKIDDHPKYIKERLKSLNQDQFGYDVFGLKEQNKIQAKYKLKGLKEKYINYLFLKIQNG